MDKLTAVIIKDQMIGETNGHMASIPNSPLLFSIFQSYCNSNDIQNNDSNKNFKMFIYEINEALKDE